MNDRERVLITIERKIFTEISTISELRVEKSDFKCYTLEDMDRHLESGGFKIPKQTAIPRGIYKVILNFSDRFMLILPLLLGVDQFTGVRFHPGNYPVDTEGCILPGTSYGTDVVYNSRLALARLFKAVWGNTVEKDVWAEIK